MKHHFLLLAALLGLGLSACSDSETDSPQNEKPLGTPTISLILGEVTTESVSVQYTTSSAESAAMLALKADQAVPTVAEVLDGGVELTIAEGLQAITLDGLEAGTAYKLYAAAANSQKSTLSTLDFTTVESEPERPVLPGATHISPLETTKLSFSYAVDVEPGTSYMHTYLEGWFFEYLLAERYMTDGEEFEMDVFLKQCLIDYGFLATDSNNYTWVAGDPNEVRAPYFATIVGGQPYYVLYAPTNPEGNDFWGDAELITLTTEEPGQSDQSLTIITEELTAKGVRIRMECPRSVMLFFYELWTTSSVEAMKAESGVEGMKQALFEYGWPVANTYTDVWGLNPNTSYTLCIMGVDVDGDTFYQEQVYTSPDLTPTVDVKLRPYERELMDYHAYDTFELTVYPYDFYDEVVNPAAIRYLFAPKSEVEQALAATGLSIEAYASNPTSEATAALEGLLRPLPALEQSMISNYGYISNLLPTLEAESEYCYLTLFPWHGGYLVGYAIEATEPYYGGGEPTEAYKAYLGEWCVVGQSSEDFYTRASLNIRFEELVPNRSYKVYGWSASDIAEEFPFEARFHPQTGKISIESIQQLGTKVIGDYEYVVVVTGMTTAGGYLSPHGGFSGVIYEGRCDGSHLSMFPGMFEYNGYDCSFVSLAYSAYYEGTFFAFEGDEYPLVNFTIDRPTDAAQTSAKHKAQCVGPRAELQKATPPIVLKR